MMVINWGASYSLLTGQCQFKLEVFKQRNLAWLLYLEILLENGFKICKFHKEMSTAGMLAKVVWAAVRGKVVTITVIYMMPFGLFRSSDVLMREPFVLDCLGLKLKRYSLKSIKGFLKAMYVYVFFPSVCFELMKTWLQETYFKRTYSIQLLIQSGDFCYTRNDSIKENYVQIWS